MNRSLFIVLFAAAVLLLTLPKTTTAADSVARDPIFIGVLTSPKATHVILIDPANGHSSGWIKMGDQFEGYQVGRYDAGTETLILTKEQSSLSVHLEKNAKVTEGTSSVRIGKIVFKIFSNSSETTDGLKVFSGSVTVDDGISRGSAEKVTFNAAKGTLEFEGTVLFQTKGGDLLVAERLTLEADPATGETLLSVRTPRQKKSPNTKQ